MEASTSTAGRIPPRRQQLIDEYTRASGNAFEEMEKYDYFTDLARAARSDDILWLAVKQWDNASHALAAALQHRLHELALRQQEYSLFKSAMDYDERLKTKLMMGYCERRIQRVQHFEQDFTRIKGSIAHLDHKIQKYNEEAMAFHVMIVQEDLHAKIEETGGHVQLLAFDNPWPVDEEQPQGPPSVVHDHARYYTKRLQEFEREKEKFIRWGDEKAAQKAELMLTWDCKRAKYRAWSDRCREYDEEARDVFAGRPPRARPNRSASTQPGTPYSAASPAPNFVSAQDRIRGLRRMYGSSTPIPMRMGNSAQRTTVAALASGRTVVRPGSTGSQTIRQEAQITSPLAPCSSAGYAQVEREPSTFDPGLNILDDQTDFEAARAQFAAVSLSERVTPASTVGSRTASGSGPSNEDSGYGASGSSKFSRDDLRWLTGDNEKREGSSHKSWHDAWQSTARERQDATDAWEADMAREDNRLSGLGCM